MLINVFVTSRKTRLPLEQPLYHYFNGHLKRSYLEFGQTLRAPMIAFEVKHHTWKFHFRMDFTWERKGNEVLVKLDS